MRLFSLQYTTLFRICQQKFLNPPEIHMIYEIVSEYIMCKTVGGIMNLPEFLTRIIAVAIAAVTPLGASESDVPPEFTLLSAFSDVAINNGELMLYTPPPPPPEIPDVSAPPPEPPPVSATIISRNTTHSDEREITPYSGRIVQRTFRPESGGSYIHLPGGGQVRNTSEHTTNAELESQARLPLSFTTTRYAEGGEPQVLIIHTHTTETFADVSDTFRTGDSSRNITAVGAAIAHEIAKAGFGVVHDGTLHDYPVFQNAYGRSRTSIQAILDEFPSIQIVLDIHRDAFESNGNPVAPVANVNGRQAAQIMIIAAADDGEWNVPNFMQNFRFASRLQSQIERDNPGLTRALWFKPCGYNQQLTPATTLIEVGSHGNTFEQALYAGELLGQSIGRMLDEIS
jgi:stage II sporulation protein P